MSKRGESGMNKKSKKVPVNSDKELYAPVQFVARDLPYGKLAQRGHAIA